MKDAMILAARHRRMIKELTDPDDMVDSRTLKTAMRMLLVVLVVSVLVGIIVGATDSPAIPMSCTFPMMTPFS
jgi:hypothetical protein